MGSDTGLVWSDRLDEIGSVWLKFVTLDSGSYDLIGLDLLQYAMVRQIRLDEPRNDWLSVWQIRSVVDRIDEHWLYTLGSAMVRWFLRRKECIFRKQLKNGYGNFTKRTRSLRQRWWWRMQRMKAVLCIIFLNGMMKRRQGFRDWKGREKSFVAFPIP